MAGRMINDHSSWIGKGSKGKVYPDGAKMKQEHSAEGAGAIMDYPDTTEKIRRDQEMGEGKIKGRPMKPGYRY